MVSAKHHPFQLPPQALDAYLAKGWFRMNQTIFITHFLHFESRFYPAVWLRYSLKYSLADLTDKKLKSIQRRFQIRVMPWKYTTDQEALFALYSSQAGIDMTPTLFELLMGVEEVNIFNTMQVEMFDDLRLVALGIFDVGDRSAAGIANIYHPDYRKYSLGKALLYTKIQYCGKQGFDWFYPGYAVPGRSRFNYKLAIAPNHTEYFCPIIKQWQEYVPNRALPNLLQDMERGLCLLQENLSAQGRKASLVYYRHFDANLIGLGFTDLLHYPLFLLLGVDPDKSQWLIAVYDLIEGKYNLLLCNTIYSTGQNSFQENWVCTDVLQVSDCLAKAFDMQDIIEVLNIE